MTFPADAEGSHIVAWYSEDGGATWRDSGLGFSNADPWVAFAPDGTVAATWRDPAFEVGPRCFGVAFSWSDDGGASFHEPETIAEPTCASVPGNQVPVSAARPDLTVERRFGDGGDYHGLVALGPGEFRALWSDTRSGVYRLWTARVTVVR